jgi:hypothetical protein
MPAFASMTGCGFVIPAKDGIQSSLDACFRGNDDKSDSPVVLLPQREWHLLTNGLMIIG